MRKYKMGIKFYLFVTLAYLIILELSSMFILIMGKTIGDNLLTGIALMFSGIFGVIIGSGIADNYNEPYLGEGRQ